MQFQVTTLTQEEGKIRPFEGWTSVQIALPSDYPRTAPVVLVLAPPNLFHPNIAGRLVCLGAHAPTLWLDEKCRRLWDLLSYRLFTMGEGLNEEACRWARHHQELFPTDKRPFCDRKTWQIEVW